MGELISEILLNKRLSEKEAERAKTELYCKAVNNNICPVCGDDLVKTHIGYAGLIFRNKKIERHCKKDRSHFSEIHIINPMAR